MSEIKTLEHYAVAELTRLTDELNQANMDKNELVQLVMKQNEEIQEFKTTLKIIEEKLETVKKALGLTKVENRVELNRLLIWTDDKGYNELIELFNLKKEEE